MNFHGASNEGGLYVPHSNQSNGILVIIYFDLIRRNIVGYQLPQNDGSADEIELDQNTTTKRLTRQVQLLG